jgi:hypothetical protein
MERQEKTQDWKDSERPGQFGKSRNQKIFDYNMKYAPGNWKLAWKWQNDFIEHDLVLQIYEDAYYLDSFNREERWFQLINNACNVYDNVLEDVESGLSYEMQKYSSTHLQDIAIRRVLFRRGLEFKGQELIQIKGKNKDWKDFSPGFVKFHLPEFIEQPPITSWWMKDSIEDFYQSNKHLMIRK